MSWEFISNLLLASVRMATPLIFLALAELYSQRAGLVHIGLEGLASIGSLVGFLVSLITGNPFLGVLAGAAAGILVNMIYAYATITLCAEQIVYGMAINIFAPALASFIYRVYFGAGSELVQVSLMETLASRMGITANGFITKLFLDQTPMVYLAYLLVVFTVIYFNRTKSGLNYKAVGEYPKAAATLGIDVIGIKYTASVICGALAGIGGVASVELANFVALTVSTVVVGILAFLSPALAQKMAENHLLRATTTLAASTGTLLVLWGSNGDALLIIGACLVGLPEGFLLYLFVNRAIRQCHSAEDVVVLFSWALLIAAALYLTVAFLGTAAGYICASLPLLSLAGLATDAHKRSPQNTEGSDAETARTRLSFWGAGQKLP